MRVFGCAVPLAAPMPLRFMGKSCVFVVQSERIPRSLDELHAPQLWSAVTCHRFDRFADSSAKQSRVQRLGEYRYASP
jgi:hypothetical protein